ncbi:MAG: hypothetical protein C5B49_09095 [Bdellovibrio sp.]|nr:MAG: hypothetical protein C5B49_09095 [Bdellovibrio sp.]
MKVLNALELGDEISSIQGRIEGAQLQRTWTDGDELLCLELHGKDSLVILIDLRRAHPFVVFLWGQELLARWKDVSKTFTKKPKPLSLFLTAHAGNLFVQELNWRAEEGRVVEFHFGKANSPRRCDLRLVLVPHAVNAIVEAGEKKVSWNPTRELAATVTDLLPPEPRDWQQWGQDFLSWRWPGQATSRKSSIDIESKLRKDLAKKIVARGKLEESLHSDLESRLRQMGEALKQPQEVPEEFMDLWDPRMTVAGNREKAFAKAKSLKQKRQGTELRLKTINEEIARMELQLVHPESIRASPKQAPPGTRAMANSAARGRTLQLAGGLQAIIGKSGADNLAILRQARPFDLWLHIKDEPSAHAIIFRNKGQSVPHSELERVARWILEQKTRGKLSQPMKFEVLVVECRYVRPIKGDKLGRVTYHSAAVFSLVYDRASQT